MGPLRMNDISKVLFGDLIKIQKCLNTQVESDTIFTSWENRKEENLSSCFCPHPVVSYCQIFVLSFLSITGQPSAQSFQRQILELFSVSLLLSPHIQATTVSCLYLPSLEAISTAIALVHILVYFLDHFPTFPVSLPVACPMRPSSTFLLDGLCKAQLEALLSQNI